MATSVPFSTFRQPRAYSLTEMQRTVLDFVSAKPNDPDLARLSTDALNLGIDQINSEIWNDIVGYQDDPLVTGSAEYTLSADVRRPRRLEMQDPSRIPRRFLTYLPMDEFTLTYPAMRVNGSPRSYTISWETRTMLLNDSPSEAYVNSYPYARLFYHRLVPHLHVPGDRLLAAASYGAFIIWFAREQIATIRAPQKVSIALLERTTIWDSLRRDNAEQITDWSH